MTQYGTWYPYTGSDAGLLAVALLVVAMMFVYLGTRLRAPWRVKTPGRTTVIFMIAIWLLSVYTFLVALTTYVAQLKQVNLVGTPPASPISVVTDLCAVGTFIIIAFLTRKHGLKLALLSGFVGAAAAPMIFEFPYDLIVVTRTFPAIPPYPLLYRELFFFPLFLVEFSTVALLTLSPLTKLSRYTFFSLAGMFLVFAIWASQGFSYPSDLTSIAFNDISKVLCFVVAITLFLGDKRKLDDSRSKTLTTVRTQE
jgi:hypothetical protein